MLFNSVSFIFLFLPLVLLLYYGINRCRFRQKDLVLNLLLIVFSLVFFCWGGFKTAVKTMPALVSIILWNYGMALLSKRWRPFLTVGIIGNIGFFFYFKIWNALIGLFNDLFSSNISLATIVIPIGLSFVLFHAISYLMDIKNGKAKPNGNFAEFALYMLFFPKLAQGPIVKYYEFEPYLHNRQVSLSALVEGIERFIIGLAKKVLVADVLAVYVNKSFLSVQEAGAGVAWIGSILFTLQIYIDFSGYSDMAIGLGRMFGFKIPENFNFPYSSTSISEFWRRWHISLGSWFKEYLYIPLGGSRTGNVYLNLLIVFLVTGLWHGVSSVFILWGLMHGLCVIVEKYLSKKGWFERIPKFIRWIYTMFVVNIGWIAFKTPTWADFGRFVKYLLGMVPTGEKDALWLYFMTNQRLLVLFFVCVLVMTIFGNVCVQKRLRQWNEKSVVFAIVKSAVLLLLFVVAICGIASSAYKPFLYFQF